MEPSPTPVSVTTASCLSENNRASTPLTGALLKSDSTLTTRASREGSEECNYVDHRSEDRRETGHGTGHGNIRLDGPTSATEQRVVLLPQKSSTTLPTDVASSAISVQRHANVGGQFSVIQHAVVVTSARKVQQGVQCNRHGFKRLLSDWLVER